MVAPLVAAGAIGAAGALGAGLLGHHGQHKANKANIQMAREQMDWQEGMSNTAYQRVMKDMYDAGLNPILAAKLGGASTPPGAMAQSQSELGAGVSSAMDYKRMKAEVDNMREMNAKIKAETGSIDLMNQLSITEQLNKNAATASQIRLQNAQGDLADSQVVMNAINAKGSMISNEQMSEILKGMKLEGEIDETTFGAIMRYLSRGASVLPFVNSYSGPKQVHHYRK